MATKSALTRLEPEGLLRFQSLQDEAVNAVTKLFYSANGSLYERFGARGRDACRQDLASHLEFLGPVLEFGDLQPMVDIDVVEQHDDGAVHPPRPRGAVA